MKISEIVESANPQSATIKKISSIFGPEVAKEVMSQGNNSVMFLQDKTNRNWKIFKGDNGAVSMERDFMLEGDTLMFEGKNKALVGTIIKLTDDTIVLEGGTYDFNTEEIEEGVGKWIGAAALAGLLGLGATNLLDTGAPERTPLGRAMSAAAAKGDKYAAKELRNLRLYIDAGDYGKIAGLKDTYLHVPTASNPAVKEMIGPEDPPGEMETDLSTMPHRNQMLAISAEIWHLLHEAPGDEDYKEEFDYLDDEARKLGFEPVIGIDPYPFLDINWHHKETDRYFKITPEKLKQDQSFRGTVNETINNFTIDDIKHLETLNGLNDVKRQAISLVSTPSKRPISPEKQAWLKNEINGKKDKMAVIKLMYDLMLGGEGMKVIGSNSKYRRRFDEDTVGDRRSFTVTVKFDDSSKATRVFLAKDRDEALEKAKAWAKKEKGEPKDIKIIAEGLSQTDIMIEEAKYHGREVKLGKPMAGDVKKYKVYVRDPKTGNIKKVNFGDKGMEIKRDNPERRRNFRKRHGCGTPRASDRTKAAYWSCKLWSTKRVSDILKGK